MREATLRSIQGAHLVAIQLPDGTRRIIDASKTAFVAGMHQALLLAAILMFAAAVLTFLLLPDQVVRTQDINW